MKDRSAPKTPSAPPASATLKAKQVRPIPTRSEDANAEAMDEDPPAPTSKRGKGKKTQDFRINANEVGTSGEAPAKPALAPQDELDGKKRMGTRPVCN